MNIDIDRWVEYFLEPKRKGYDTPKTIVYALLLVAAVYGVYELLKKLKVGIDMRLAVAIAPYVILGSTIRVLEDLHLLSGYIFVTPTIYVLVFAITITTLLLSLLVERKKGIPYFKPTFIVGVLLLPIPLSYVLLSSSNLYGALLVAAFYLPWLVVFKFVKWSVENKATTLLQMFDATATFVSLQFFNFYEQHVLPTAFIDIFGPASFIVVKAVVVIAMLIAIDKFSKDREFNTYIKLIIGLLGAATGIRDFLALISLV